MKTYQRFLEYVKTNTQSDPDSNQHPSSEIQKHLGIKLVSELKELGLTDAFMDEHSYVYATLKANTEKEIEAIGFISHLDTSPDFSGENVKASVIDNYDGNDVVLNQKAGITMKTSEFPFLKDLKEQSLIVTDGTTLLGADDKAGIAEIMTMLEYFQDHPEIEHGIIRIAFTPDEEIGEGPLFFNYDYFQVRYAYTVDGGKEGVINYENFNAASCNVTIHGINIHPGSAKNIMRNSILVAMEFNSMLPPEAVPSHTELYEGFFHLNSIQGDVETTKLNYIIRNHDKSLFRKQKDEIIRIQNYLNEKYGKDTVECEIHDTYYNMVDIIQDHMEVIKTAEKAIKDSGMTPAFSPIRGGTDGAQLTYHGLICPNLATGGWNAHGRYECITVEAMEKCTETLINIVKTVTKEK